MTYIPIHDWPILERYNLTVRVPHGYMTDPNDPKIFIPDLEKIKFYEEALDLIDAGHPSREVADWLTPRIGRSISHQGIINIWKKYRSKDKTNPRAKIYRKRRRAMLPKTKQGKEERKAKLSVQGAERALRIRKDKLEALKNKPDITGVVFSETIEEPEDDREVIFRPHPGPQTEFLAASEQQILYGGPLEVNTFVVTPDGYLPIKDLELGDIVYTPEGMPTEVIGIPFEGEEDSYKITFGDGASVVASAGHKWLVSTGDWKKTEAPWRTKRTNELLDFKLPSGKNKYSIPTTKPINFSEVEHVISPYTLGVLLGDGTFTVHKTPSFVSIDKDIVDRVAAETPEDLVVRSYDNSIAHSISRGPGSTKKNPITSELARLKLVGRSSLTKFIPKEYLFDSVTNRISLLRGLMDTDGTIRQAVRSSAECKYTTISKELRNNFIFLAQSLGYYVTSYEEVLASGNIAYRIIITGRINPFYLARKSDLYDMHTSIHKNRSIINVEPVGQQQVRCITISDSNSLFLIDNCVVTFNSAGGGKSYAMLVDPMRDFGNSSFNGILFRKTNDELRELISKSHELYPKAYPGAKWQEQKSRWIFPSGAQLWLTYLDKDLDVERYQGQAFTWIGFDELGHWATPYAWNYMASRLRSTDPTVSLSQRATANPGGLGGWWIKKMFINPAPPNQAFWATDLDTGEVLRYPPDHKERPNEPLFKRRFIPAKLSDNPSLANDGRYEASLLSLSKHLQQQLLYGNWDVMEGAAFSEFDANIHVIEPFKIPDSWKKFRSCDYGYASHTAAHWFAIDPAHETLIVYRELYTSKKTGRELAHMILDLEKGEKIQYGILDSSVWQQRGQTGPSIAEEMIMEGCRWRPADRSKGSRSAGKNRLHELLKPRDMGAMLDGTTRLIPGIQFFNTCRQIIADLPTLPTHPNGEDDIDDRHASDHTYDSIRYGIMSRPRAVSVFDFGGNEYGGSRYQPADRKFGY